MSDTRRTDECLGGIEHGNAIEGLCRQLERELNKANEELSKSIRVRDILRRKLTVAMEYVNHQLTQENPVCAAAVLKEIEDTK